MFFVSPLNIHPGVYSKKVIEKTRATHKACGACSLRYGRVALRKPKTAKHHRIVFESDISRK
jgi:hypothetical protein